MKKPLNPLPIPTDCRQSFIRRPLHLIGAFLMTTLAAQADASLTFDTDTQGVVAGGDATSVVWDSVGQRLEINTTGGYKAQCAYLDLFGTDPGIVALKAEFDLAMINGGTLSYDIVVETTSVTGGNPGWFETMYIGNSSGGWDQQYGGGTGQITAYGAFPLANPIIHTVTYPIVNGSAASDAIAQFNSTSGWFQINLGVNSQGGTTIKYYIDNITVSANVVAAPTVIPQLSIAPAKPGLHIMGNSAGQYDLHGIRVQGEDLSWVAPGVVYPKSYEFTISDIDYAGQRDVLLYLACPSATQETNGFGTDKSAPDYSAADCVVLACHQNDITDPFGSSGILRYKVDNPDSNNSLPGGTGRSYYDPDTLLDGNGGNLPPYLSSVKRVGAWKLTFSDATTYTITNPDGTTSAPYTFPASIVSRFAGKMYVYVSCGVDGSGSQRYANTIISSFKITENGVSIVEQDFTTTTFVSGAGQGEFQICADGPSPKSVVQVTPDLGTWWLSWTPIDPTFSGFKLIQSTDLGVTDSWDTNFTTPIPTSSSFNSRIGKTMLLPTSAVSDPNRSFFRLQQVKP